ISLPREYSVYEKDKDDRINKNKSALSNILNVKTVLFQSSRGKSSLTMEYEILIPCEEFRIFVTRIASFTLIDKDLSSIHRIFGRLLSGGLLAYLRIRDPLSSCSPGRCK